MPSSSNVRKLTEGAICVAVAVVLSLFTLFHMPLGGSVTPFSTMPIIVIGLRHKWKWGVACALVFSLVQLMIGMGNVLAVPVKNLESMIICALLDYIIAYALLGFAGSIARRQKNDKLGMALGILLTAGFGRLFCSFLSGVVIWGPFAPEGWNVAVYSLVYNLAWCLPDTVITMVACLLLAQIRALGLFPSKNTGQLDRGLL